MPLLSLMPIVSMLTFLIYSYYDRSTRNKILTEMDRRRLLISLFGSVEVKSDSKPDSTNPDRSEELIQKNIVRRVRAKQLYNPLQISKENKFKDSLFRVRNFFFEILTSFFIPITNFVLIFCWFLSGDFLDYDRDGDTVASFGTQTCPCFGNSMSITRMVILVTILFMAMANSLVACTKSKYLHKYLSNAAKHALCIAFVIYSYLSLNFRHEVVFCFILTVICWLYDVVVDWGLFRVIPGFSSDKVIIKKTEEIAKQLGMAEVDVTKKYFLRKIRVYPRSSYYYLAILLDLPLRFLWVVQLIPDITHVRGAKYDFPYFMVLFGGVLECIRRGIWYQFKYEYDQIKARYEPHIIASNIENIKSSNANNAV